METEIKKHFRPKRICALLTVIIIIANLFSPYGVLMNNTIYAAEPAERRTLLKTNSS